MKRTMIGVSLTVGLMVSTAGATRTWVPEQIRVGGATISCLEHPSLALQLGSMPVVVTNGENTGSPTPTGVRRTPFGWETYMGPGYIAGDGGRNIEWNTYPINYGADGYFYTPSGNTSSAQAMSLRGGAWYRVSTPWPYGGGGGPGYQPAVDTDASGNIYMVIGSKLAMYSGGVWSTAKNLSMDLGMNYISELAVSPFGEVAVSGYTTSGSTTKTVAWFDFKTAGWHTRAVATGMNNVDTIGIEWDKNGNLGVAYSDNTTRVKFDYLDMESGLWTSEVVLDNSTGPYYFKGAALAFDRFSNPVIASGQYLIYDPVVPEPMTLLMGLAGAGVVLRRRTQA